MTLKFPEQAYDVRFNATRSGTLLVRGLEAFEINDTSAAIWQLCDGNTSIAEIARRLAGDFDVPEERATSAVASFLQMARSASLLES
jgi:Coenzyme PQQ synthesis protein D (PqqD)